MSRHKLTTFGEIIKALRLENNMPQRRVAALLDIDTSILSKYEKNVRQPSNDIIDKIAKIFDVDKDKLRFEAFTDKIANQFIQDDIDSRALRVAESKVEYIKSKKKI